MRSGAIWMGLTVFILQWLYVPLLTPGRSNADTTA